MSPPHVLALPLPAQGHINPLLHLCDRLVSMGFIVTFVNVRSVHERMVQSRPQGGRLLGNLEMFLTAAATTMKLEIEKLVQELNEDASSPPLTCIISDPFFGWTQDVAEKNGICRACLWTASASFALITWFFPHGQGKHHEQAEDHIVDSVPGVPPFPIGHLPLRFRAGNEVAMKHRMVIQKTDAWVLVNSFYDLEKKQFEELQKLSPNIVPAGPFIPWRDQSQLVRQEDAACMQWLDEQPARSVLYISFGSLATLPSDDIQELALSLKRSEQTFLWVVRLDLVETDDKSDEILKLLKQSDRGKIVSWAPQMKVLQHDSVAAFLTHCGWNSLMETVASGTPILAWPCVAEQKINSMLAVEHWKVGFSAYSSSKPSADEIEGAISKIMGKEGNKARENMMALSSACIEAVSQDGSSQKSLEPFLEDMRNRATTSAMP